MAMGQQKDRQGDLMVSWSEMPRSPGHVFYDRLQLVLIEGGFDGFAEAVCQPYYAARMGAPSVPPGRYFRMHLVGYFEGIDSERGLEWRCSALSHTGVPAVGDAGTGAGPFLAVTDRARLPHEVHTAVFDWVLALIAEAGLVKGERIGVDASTMEAQRGAAQHRAEGHGRGLPGDAERLAQESGIETPTAEDLARLDRKRKGKKLSNQDWVSRSDPDCQDRQDAAPRTWPTPEHAVDLDTGAVVVAELHPADEGDTTTLPKTLAAAEANLEAVDVAPTAEDPAECVTDKGYHSRLVLKALDDGPWKSRISEPKQKGFARWHGDDAARRAVTNNRTRLRSGVAREAFKLRAEIVLRRFCLTALLCPQPRSRRYAPDLASGPRERAQAIPASRRRPQPIVADAPTHRRRHPEGGRGGRNWRLVRACYARWSRPGVQIVLIAPRMAKPPSPRYASPWRETRSMTPFSTGC